MDRPLSDPPGEPPHQTLREAALHAEYETGRHEATEKAAKAHVAVRIARMTAGSILTVAGLAMLPLPGPGLPIVASGLAILARDVAWADRLLGYVRSRIPRDDDGAVSRATLVTMIVSGAAGLVFGVWLMT